MLKKAINSTMPGRAPLLNKNCNQQVYAMHALNCKIISIVVFTKDFIQTNLLLN